MLSVKSSNFIKISNGVKIKSIRAVKNLTGKTVLLRGDFNVPIKSGRIKDDYKIVAALPTIRYLLRHKAKLVIATHADNKQTARPLAMRLSQLLDKRVLFARDCSGEATRALIGKMSDADIVFLENLRLHRGEENNDKKFAKALAALADIYVNDAFAVSHRQHASVSAIKKYLPSYAGLLLEREVENLSKVLTPKKPLISIIGGAKIGTKIDLINNLAKKSDRLLIGGALANNLIAAHGFKIGKSLSDKASIALSDRLIKRHRNIILPVDAAVGKKFKSNSVKIKPVNQVQKDDIILDIGPRTVKLFMSFIKKARTIIWNGPMGYFENEHFKHGTLAIARVVASRSSGPAFGVAGGGETIEALRLTKMEHYLDWVSTGGGAMLAFLGGEKMPGLKGIVK